MRKEAREKLVEKDIEWGQVYTDKTKFLKEMFSDVIGPGSYFRFEGTDSSSGDSYYCILGPAKIHKPRAKFFAGVRKLPATFSAGGKYFDSMDSAARYARETWGVPTPKELKPYTSSALYGIAKKTTSWKKQNEQKDERVRRKKEEDKDKDKGDEPDTQKKESSGVEIFNLANYHRYLFGMAKPQVYREQATWWNYSDIMKYKDVPIESLSPEVVQEMKTWQQALQEEPTLLAVLAEAEEFRYGKQGVFDKLRSLYNMNDDEIQKVFQTYIGYHPQYGSYITSVGPYLGAGMDEPESYSDKFGYYVIKKSRTTMGDIMKQAWQAASKYKNADIHFNKPEDPRRFFTGVALEPKDFYVQFRDLKGTSFYQGKKKDDPSLRLNNLDWELPIPSSPVLAKEYKGKLNWLAGRYKPEEAQKVAIEMMSDKYNTTSEYIEQEISFGAKARTEKDLQSKAAENKRRMEQNESKNPEALSFVQQSPMVRTGTTFKLNPSGQYKVARQYLLNLGVNDTYFEKGIDLIVSKYPKEYPDREALIGVLTQDKKAINRVYNATLSAYGQDVAQQKAPPIDFIDFGKLNIKTSVGQQQFGALPSNIGQARQLAVRIEIADALTKGVTRIRDIQDILNDAVERRNEQRRHQQQIGQAEPEVKYEFVRDQLNELKDLAQKKGYAEFGQLSTDLQQQYEGLTDPANKGFEDLQTAYNVLSLYFTSLPVDPRTRAKYITKRKRMIFNPPEGFQNYTIKELAEKRMTGVLPTPIVEVPPEESAAAKQLEQIEEIEEIEEQNDSGKQISEMVKKPITEKIKGKPQEIIEQDTRKVLVPPYLQEGPSEENEPQDDEGEEDREEEDTMASVKRLNKIFRRTVGNLIKVARELDQDGNPKGAEEIHAVIRKYQERLK